MPSRMRVSGLNQVARNMRNLPVKMQRKVVRPALTAASKPMVKAISRRAPIKTGLTSRSIMAKFKRPRRGTETIMVGVNKRAYYWRFQEFGTSKHAAQPFVRPGFAESSGEALRIFTEVASVGVLAK